MHFNQEASPHHCAGGSASLSLAPVNVNRRRSPPPRARYSTLPGHPLQPQIPLATTSTHPRHIPIPPSLTPGRQPPFVNVGATQFNSPNPLFLSPQRTSFYGDYFYTRPYPSLPPPPLPQKPLAMAPPPPPTLARPPVPPRPSLISSASSPSNPSFPQPIPDPVPVPVPGPGPSIQPAEYPSSDKDIALALALSKSEARQREEGFLAQEEADLVKALEVSRTFPNSHSGYGRDNFFDRPQDLSRRPSLSSQSSMSSLKAMTFLNPEAITAHRTSIRPPETGSFLHMTSPTTSEHSLDGDDFVPQPSVESQESSQSVSDESLSSSDHSTPTPPLYAHFISNIIKPKDIITDDGSDFSATSAMFSSPVKFPRSSDHVRPSPVSNSVSPYPTSSPHPSAPEHSPRPSQPRRPSATYSESSSSSARSSSNEHISSLSSTTKSSQGTPTSPPLSSSSFNIDPLDSVDEDLEEDEEGDEENARPAPGLTANQYVEPDMLMGVSMGFSRPAISTILSPMAMAMPNVITVPYGKAPTFHFQAPTWRHLLKLMARLSGTRVEPTLEALTVAKHELKLRTVIQFVKIHHSASEWRTVLYLTIDMPVPPTIQNSYKYTNGDVTMLPYSYTLSPLPPLLRDGADTTMAKYYVVPATSSTPYPTLPINFPNLAMYLQSAVEDSRKAANDSSGGSRKLAHNIDSCYRRDNERPISVDFSDTSRSRMSGMLKRVIKRGKTPRGAGGNEEIYDLVTPFVSEEWG